jgi:hypothetical protein
MKANRVYRLIVRRGGLPGPFARNRTDHIEVVEMDTLEVVLFWTVPYREARTVVRQLRLDLAQLEAEEFMTQWEKR